MLQIKYEKFGEKFFFFGSKIIFWIKKFMSSKKFWVQKMFPSKKIIFWSKKIFSQKKNLVQKKFDSKNCLIQKEILVQINFFFDPKKLNLIKYLVQKT